MNQINEKARKETARQNETTKQAHTNMSTDGHKLQKTMTSQN